VPGKNWFAYFRFYQPTEAYFNRSWPLPDFEQLWTNATVPDARGTGGAA